LTYQVEKTFSENRDKLDAAATSEMEAALADAKAATTEGGVERMNEAFNRLQTASHKIAEALYQQQGSSAAATITSLTPNTLTWTRISKKQWSVVSGRWSVRKLISSDH
jgi:molecular chaperone DnaK